MLQVYDVLQAIRYDFFDIKATSRDYLIISFIFNNVEGCTQLYNHEEC